MPQITPKSPEVLQAQAAAFSAECPGYGDGADLVRELGIGSVDGMEVAIDTRPSEPERTLSAREENYIEFLRENGGQSSPSVQVRAKILEKYKAFAPAVGAVLEELEGVSYKEWPEHPSFIGKGRYNHTFSLEHEGQSYALRVPAQHGYDLDAHHVRPTVLAKGQDNLEQVVAASYEEGVTISEFIPGRGMDGITQQEMARIPDEHLAGFVGTIETMSKSKLIIEPNPSNILYDPETGFSIIDFVDTRYRGPIVVPDGGIASMLRAGADVLAYPAHIGEAYIEMTQAGGETAKAKAELYETFVSILNRYKAICEKRFADDPNIEMIQANLGSVIDKLKLSEQMFAGIAGSKTLPDQSTTSEELVA